MESSTLSKEEKASIFEIVNNMYLGYRGNKKKETKKSFKNTWKEDNNCFRLIMTLYNAEDILEGSKGKLEDDINGGWVPVDWETKKVSWKHYAGMCKHLGESIDELERTIDDVEEGKGYISEEKHKDDMKKQLEEQQEIIRALSDDVRKYKRKGNDYEYALEKHKKKSEEMLFYWRNNCEKICPKCNLID
jgi:chromosome segregation ATPase